MGHVGARPPSGRPVARLLRGALSKRRVRRLAARRGNAVNHSLGGEAVPMKVVLIYNRSSGGAYTLPRIRTLFRRHGVRIDYSFTTRQLNSNKLSTLIKKGVTVAVIGGDGTFNSAARLLVGSPSTLLPLPGGTFNHFVRDLGMPPTVEEVIANLEKSTTRQIDVAYVNDELFLNNSNLGLYPFSLIERKLARRIVGKWAAAALSIFDQITAFRRHRLTIDGERVQSPFVFVGNNIYDIRTSLIPRRTSFTRRTLTVMISSSATRRAFFRGVLAVLKGDVSQRQDFEVTRRKELTIYSHRATIPVSFDGEVKKLTPPLHYRVEPACLRILSVKTD